jgi:cytochrome c
MSPPTRLLAAALAISSTAFIACDNARIQDATAQAEAQAPAARPAGEEPAEPVTPVAAKEAEPSAASPAPRTAQAETPSAKSGQLKFNNFCRTCHSVREGDHRLGPSLHGVVGRKAGTAPGFRNYSQALANSGIVWDEQSLDKFLENPDALVPGNNMKPFSRLADPRVREDIIAHLKTAGPSGSEN